MMIWCTVAALLPLLVNQVSFAEEASKNREDFCLSIVDSTIDYLKKLKNAAQASARSTEMDCAGILQTGRNQSGIYTIYPKSRISRGKPLTVYCDMQTDGGGWTVIQRRGEFGRERDYFRKGWKNYKEGFGDIDKEFWLGNDNIFALTNQDLYSVRFDLRDVEGARRYAVYDTFWIDDEERKYTLHIKGYRGDAGDSMTKTHDNQKFTTSDQKNDNSPNENCADLDKGAWWYNNCHQANLNGIFYKGTYESPNYDGIVWYTWKGYKESMTSAEIKIRPKDFRAVFRRDTSPNNRTMTSTLTPPM